MQIIFRTVDGKDFTSEIEARQHESKLYDGIIMLNRNNKRVYETSQAFLVWLKDENANLAFHAIARAEGDDAVKSITEGEDYGLYYWDEGYEEYRWIDTDMIDGLIQIKQMVEGRGDRFDHHK